MKIFSDYIAAQLRYLADKEEPRYRALLDALAPHAFDGTELHHAIDEELRGLENAAQATALKLAVVKKYCDTIPINLAVEILLKLIEDGRLP